MIISIAIISLIILFIIVYLIIDYVGPKYIALRNYSFLEMPCLKANDLMVQEYDCEGNLWATRGLIIYCLHRGDNKFSKITRVPSEFSFYWLNNFRIFRLFTLRSECVEMSVGSNGQITAFSSGSIWHYSGNCTNFQKIHRLKHFGLNVGRGLMSTGILLTRGNDFFLGEYFNNPDRNEVSILHFNYEAQKFLHAHVFERGSIRHIHSLQKDQYSGKLWICTGDNDNEAMIGFSIDGFKSITPIGDGSQTWRACQLVFTEEAIIWGTDTGSEDLAGIYSLDRSNLNLRKIYSLDGAVFFAVRLSNGIIVMTTDREGFENEKDDKTKLIFINEDKVCAIPFGTWKYKKHGFRFNFAKIRLQRNSGSKFLAVSILNHKEFSESDFLLFNQEVISSRFKL
jgi:hypothetical protein